MEALRTRTLGSSFSDWYFGGYFATLVFWLLFWNPGWLAVICNPGWLVVILQPKYSGCYFATLVGCWSCGALEQLELSCGGRLAAHIVGGQAEALGRAEGGPEFHPGAELLKRVGGWAPSPPPNHQPLPLQPGACYIRCSGGQTFPWVFARLMNK